MSNNGINDVIPSLASSTNAAADELGFYIYSDVLGQMFACQTYKVVQGGIVNFNNLEIPCKDYLILILVEKDYIANDGYALLLPCALSG